MSRPPDTLIAAWASRLKLLREARAVQDKSDRLLGYGRPERYCLAVELKRLSTRMILKAEREFTKALKAEYGSRYRVERHTVDNLTIWVREPRSTVETAVLFTKSLKLPPKPKPARHIPTTFKEAVLAARAKHYPKL